MTNNPVGWFEIYVEDMARAAAFYERVFQVQLAPLAAPEGTTPGMEMRTFSGVPDRYGAPGALVKMAGVKPGGNSVLVYFSCADCAVEAARVAGAGGTLVKDKFAIGQYGHIALATDTEGNMIGLHSMA